MSTMRYEVIIFGALILECTANCQAKKKERTIMQFLVRFTPYSVISYGSNMHYSFLFFSWLCCTVKAFVVEPVLNAEYPSNKIITLCITVSSH